MKNVKLLPFACALILPFCLDARDLYVYDDGNNLISTVREVKEISFDETNTKVISLSNEATSIELKSISFFTMNGPISGITENVSETGITACMDNETLHIKANEPVQRVEIYSKTGSLLDTATPNAIEYSHNMADLQNDVYLIKIVSGENQLIQKIVKK